jgi:hypothetical protein
MDVPARSIETEQVTPDTYVIRQMFGEGLGPSRCSTCTSRCPWLEPVDPARYVTSAHGPTLRDDQVGWALDQLTQLPNRRPVSDLSHADLEALLASLPLPAAA